MRPEQITQLNPGVSGDTAAILSDGFNATFEKFNIQTPRQVRYFIAQSCFETQYFTKFVENLNYSRPERLVEVWPTRFTLDANQTNKAYAPNYVRNPQGLANIVYAGRNGNGSPETGDGYNFRGAGAFHLTGRGNYVAASHDIYGDDRLVQNPELVQSYDVGILTAGWFWNVHKLNALADKDSFTEVTRIINGSTATVPARLEVLAKVNEIF